VVGVAGRLPTHQEHMCSIRHVLVGGAKDALQPAH
jgi:hypothetical protein